MAKTRPQVIWVSPELATAPRSGADLRTMRLVQALAQRTDLTLVVVGHGDESRLAAATGAAAVRIFARPPGRPAKTVAALGHGWPTGTGAAWSPPARSWVAGRAGAGATVVVDHVQMAPYLPAGGHVLSTHNAEAALLAQAARPDSRVERVLLRWDATTIGRLERRAVARAGLVVAVSELDAAMLGGNALVVPNGADLPARVPPLPAGGDVLFVAALKYAPNRAALRWWAEAVWQPQSLPLTVVGSGPEFLPPELAEHPGLRCTGPVEDVGPALTAAGVVAIPLLHGGGTRLKVLEAMAWGRPVVSTSKGVEGLAVVAGEHVVIADDPAVFAREVARLRGDLLAATQLGERARAFAEAYSWGKVTPAFVERVLAVAAR